MPGTVGSLGNTLLFLYFKACATNSDELSCSELIFEHTKRRGCWTDRPVLPVTPHDVIHSPLIYFSHSKLHPEKNICHLLSKLSSASLRSPLLTSSALTTTENTAGSSTAVRTIKTSNLSVILNRY